MLFRSLSDTKVIRVAVGLLVVLKFVVVVEALPVLGVAAPASQVNVLPLNIVATNTSPKLSRQIGRASCRERV